MKKNIKRYSDFINENVEVAPIVKPKTAPTKPSRKNSPLRRNKPSVKPSPKAEDLAEKFLSLTKNNSNTIKMLKKKYNK